MLCTKDWSMYAEARERGSFVDFRDAFNNATDEQLEEGIRQGD